MSHNERVIRVGYFERCNPREIAYCEDCGRIEAWWRALYHGVARCVCGSKKVSRGELPAAGEVR